MTFKDFLYTALGGVLTGCTTILILFVKHKFLTNTKEFDELAKIRNELLIRCQFLESRMDALTTDNEKWRVRYFTETQRLNEVNMSLKHDVKTLTVQLDDVRLRFVPGKYRDSYS